MKSLAVLLFLAACFDHSDREPITGPVRRYVIDHYQFPRNNTEARDFGIDLNGDRTVDNQAGMVFGTLVGQGDANLHADDMVASGVLASTVEIQADDPSDDPSVAVTYLGADGEPATPMIGAFRGGAFVTEPTDDPAARLHAPFIIDVDPLVVDFVELRIALTPDGRGGYEGQLGGAIPHPDGPQVAAAALARMAMTNPQDHRSMAGEVDKTPRDGVVTAEEVFKWDLLEALLSPDIKVGPRDAMSLGFLIHLAPCEAGHCTTPIATCFDRVRDNDEADVDCGGGCALACPGGAVCRAPADCQTKSCDGGVCATPTCSDGIRDGFESGVDCGGNCRSCL